MTRQADVDLGRQRQQRRLTWSSLCSLAQPPRSVVVRIEVSLLHQTVRCDDSVDDRLTDDSDLSNT